MSITFKERYGRIYDLASAKLVIFDLDKRLEKLEREDVLKGYVNAEEFIPKAMPIEPVYLNSFDIDFYSKTNDYSSLNEQVLNFRYEPNALNALEKIYIDFNENIDSCGLIVYHKLLNLLHTRNNIRIRITPKKLNGNTAGVFEFMAKLDKLTPLEFDYGKKSDILRVSTVWNQIVF